ncbi:MAG TPA: aminotransferase class III-fold pyridoxal phosphate-dependent enzyme, partial [Candidatus Paenalcaligenes intestinipullorum]|nr:aminotransferase class III-fold pyridoxal phosphate-dependent enzyme [Candidatus Paenalcaligenes intestinipullorum]
DNAFKEEIQQKAELVSNWLENIAQSYSDAGLSVRGRGLIQGLVAPAKSGLANKIAAECFKRGVVIETSGAHDEVLKILPSLTIPLEQLKHGLDVIESSVGAAWAETQRQKKVLNIRGA